MGNRMKKNEEKGAVVAAVPPVKTSHPLDVLTKDDFAGKGGSYTFDPATGVRVPVPESDELGKEEVAQ
jgi:hypothetical protein